MINEKISNIAAGKTNQKTSYKTIAYVVNCDEESNECEIQYRDVYGKFHSQKGVPVICDSSGKIGWFPEKGDYVDITVYSNVPEVIGKHYEIYAKDKQKNLAFKKDSYSDTLNTVFGVIL